LVLGLTYRVAVVIQQDVHHATRVTRLQNGVDDSFLVEGVGRDEDYVFHRAFPNEAKGCPKDAFGIT